MYSRQYIASFAGFAPSAAITVIVVLDSPEGEHHGGMVGAPVFQRVAQPVLSICILRMMWNSRQAGGYCSPSGTSRKKTEEGSPDRLGDQIDPNDTASIADPPPVQDVRPSQQSAGVVQAAMRQYATMPARSPATSKPSPTSKAPVPSTTPAPANEGTIVLEVEQGGIVVPSFAGKSVRAAVELAQSNSLDLDIVGSGLGMEQSPAAGSHVAAGSRVVVEFGL